MKFVFSRLFYLLLAAGLILLSLSWGHPWLSPITLVYDCLLLIGVLVDARTSRFPPGVSVRREFGGRFAMGAQRCVIAILNSTARPFSIIVKDEYADNGVERSREGV
jgi:hypothetical protein